MQMPARRHVILIGALAAAALGACNSDDTQPAPPVTTPPKAACGKAAFATANLHCPPGVTAPKS